MAPLEQDILRDYDVGLAAKFVHRTETVAGTPRLVVDVPGVSKPVPLGVGMPEEWYAEVGYPHIAITRGPFVPDVKRIQPAFRGQQLSTNPDTPNTWNIQKDVPQPVNILYTVEVQADNMAAFNAVLLYVMTRALPLAGFGTGLTAFGQEFAYRGTGSKDLTDYTTKDGRLFRMALSYVVEGWLFTLDCVKVPQILHVDIALETHPAASGFTPEEAHETRHILINAPVTP